MAEAVKKILIAEDERPLAKALQLKLKQLNFDVTVVNDGEAAIEVATHNQFDLVLLDLMMPNKNGFDVLTALQQQGITVPVIIASNLSQQEDIKRAHELGAKDFFVKSEMTLANIIEKIQQFLG